MSSSHPDCSHHRDDSPGSRSLLYLSPLLGIRKSRTRNCSPCLQHRQISLESFLLSQCCAVMVECLCDKIRRSGKYISQLIVRRAKGIEYIQYVWIRRYSWNNSKFMFQAQRNKYAAIKYYPVDLNFKTDSRGHYYSEK